MFLTAFPHTDLYKKSIIIELFDTYSANQRYYNFYYYNIYIIYIPTRTKTDVDKI